MAWAAIGEGRGTMKTGKCMTCEQVGELVFVGNSLRSGATTACLDCASAILMTLKNKAKTDEAAKDLLLKTADHIEKSLDEK